MAELNEGGAQAGNGGKDPVTLNDTAADDLNGPAEPQAAAKAPEVTTGAGAAGSGEGAASGSQGAAAGVIDPGDDQSAAEEEEAAKAAAEAAAKAAPVKDERTETQPCNRGQADMPLYPPVSPELHRAAEDVRILYSYISREGRLTPDKMLEQPLTVYAEVPDRILDDKNPPDFDTRAKLWSILSELSNLARPASADTIRGSYYSELMNVTDHTPRRPVGQFIKALGVTGFVVTLMLGLYVSFTDSVVKDTLDKINEYNDISSGLFTGTRLEKLASRRTTPPKPASDQTNAKTPPQQSDAPSQAAMQDDGTPTLGFADLQIEALDELDAEIRKGFDIIRFTTFQLGQSRSNGASDANGGSGSGNGSDGTDAKGSLAPGEDANLDKPSVNTSQGAHSLFERTPLNIQGYINHTISAFILPAIASLLGSVVFILRDAQRRMESVSLSPLRSEIYGPRIILAVIAGTVIGWLSGQDTSGVFGKISPAAASFAVGYCTEILYHLLDAIKSALGVKDDEAGAKPPLVPGR